MRIPESCAKCLYDRQANITDNQEYLAEVKELIDTRDESDTSPYMVYKFSKAYEKYFGKKSSFGEIKKKYNDLVLGLEDTIRSKIEESDNPLVTALLYARIGNYIDFGAMDNVDEDTFLGLFNSIKLSDNDELTLKSFLTQCEKANSFLLITDNCGEVVLDKLFLEQFGRRFSSVSIAVLVRGGEVLNDATLEDVKYVGLDRYARVYSNGMPIAGTVFHMLPDDVKEIVKNSDVILAKGQGNYESMSNQGMHAFYSFLCKCELFTDKFKVPKLTGMFIEE